MARSQKSEVTMLSIPTTNIQWFDWKVSGAGFDFGIHRFLKCVKVAKYFTSLSYSGSNLL